jgi:hypothetical protein
MYMWTSYKAFPSLKKNKYVLNAHETKPYKINKEKPHYCCSSSWNHCKPSTEAFEKFNGNQKKLHSVLCSIVRVDTTTVNISSLYSRIKSVYSTSKKYKKSVFADSILPLT